MSFERNPENPLFTASGYSWSEEGPTNSAILRDPETCEPVQYDGSYWQAFTDLNGTLETGILESPDLVSWSDPVGSPILAPEDSGAGSWESTYVESNTLLDMRETGAASNFWLFYTGGESTADGRYKQLGIATSDDLLTWTRHGSNPVWDPNPPGGYGGEDFSVVKAAGTGWLMIYEDEGSAMGGNAVRVASSSDSLPDSGWTDGGTMFESDPTGGSGFANPYLARIDHSGGTYYEALVEGGVSGTPYMHGAHCSESEFLSQGWTDDGPLLEPSSGPESQIIPNEVIWLPSEERVWVYYVADGWSIRAADGESLSGASNAGGTEISPVMTSGALATVATTGGEVALTNSIQSNVTSLEDFEDGDLSEYSGQTGSFTVDQTDPVLEGSYSLKTDGSSDNDFIYRTDVTINQGETYRVQTLCETSSALSGCAFNVQDGSNYYHVAIDADGTPFLGRYIDGSFSNLASGSMTGSFDTEYEVAVSMDDNDIIQMNVLDPSDGSELDSFSYDASGDLEIFRSGHIGFRSNGEAIVWDNARKE